ncbi:MAG: TenA family protein [Rhodospirillales bacterium]
MSSFTENLRQANLATWEAVAGHPFAKELGDGRLADDKLRRYLIQDHRFIDHFVVLLASLVAKAPSLADRKPGCQFLALVTGEENTYFERCFAALGVTDDQRLGPPDAAVTAEFKALMAEVAASGSLARMLAVLVVCEWSYLDWANRVKHLNPPQFWHAEWITLHSGPYFESVVAYLRGLLDRVGPDLPATERAAVEADFARAITLEQAFFDHAMAG